MYSFDQHQHQGYLAILPFCPTTTPSVCLRLASYVFVCRFCEHTWAHHCFVAIEWWNHKYKFKYNFQGKTWNPRVLHCTPTHTRFSTSLVRRAQMTLFERHGEWGGLKNSCKGPVAGDAGPLWMRPKAVKKCQVHQEFIEKSFPVQSRHKVPQSLLYLL